MKGESGMRVDDTFDDVKAAMAEVAAKGSPAPEPVEKSEPVAEEVAVTADAHEDQEPQSRDGIDRDNKGRFAPRKAKAAGEEDAQVQPEAAVQAKVSSGEGALGAVPLATKVVGGPPPSFSAQSKADWEKVPEHIRADVLKREVETGTGLAALKEYQDIKPYADLAQRQGTTLSKALEKYVSYENLISQDMGKGLAVIAQNAGYSQQQAAQLFLQMAQKFGANMQPQQPQQTGDPLADAFRPLLDPVLREVQQVRNQFNSYQQAQHQASQKADEESRINRIQSEVIDTFKASHPHYDKLEDDMARLLQTGMVPMTGNHAADLEAAYATAARMNPQIAEAQIEMRLQAERDAARKAEADKVAKAKAASKSITGSRVPGTVIRDRVEANSHDDVEADVRRAYMAQNRA